jgi:hypothetical protein
MTTATTTVDPTGAAPFQAFCADVGRPVSVSPPPPSRCPWSCTCRRPLSMAVSAWSVLLAAVIYLTWASPHPSSCSRRAGAVS